MLLCVDSGLRHDQCQRLHLPVECVRSRDRGLEDLQGSAAELLAHSMVDNLVQSAG